MANEDLRAQHASFVTYLSAIVAARFTVAALYLAGAAFLASTVLDPATAQLSVIMATTVGLLLTLIMLGLEVRNAQLLDNVVECGNKLEDQFEFGDVSLHGFFRLMRNQPLPPRWPWPLSGSEIRAPIVLQFIRHKQSLSALYCVFAAFWILALLFELLGLFD
jgi:hypothetical protein